METDEIIMVVGLCKSRTRDGSGNAISEPAVCVIYGAGHGLCMISNSEDFAVL